MRPLTTFPLAAAVLAAAITTALAAPTSAEVKRTLKSGDQAAVSQLLGQLHGQLDDDAVKAILDNGPRLKPLGVYDDLVKALATARGPALEALIKGGYDKQKRPELRFLAVDALGRIPEAAAEKVLVEALEEDADEAVAVLAARSLGKRGTLSAVDALVPLLGRLESDAKKARLVREVNAALCALTGQELSVAEDWKNYWDANRDKFQPPAQASSDDAAGSQTRDRNALDRMRRERPAETRTMERMRDDEVIAIKGRSDKVEQVLKALNLPHQVKERSEFDGLELDPARQILVMNCAGTEALSDAGVAKVREFVGRGGYLFTSDWELKNVLARAFPEVVAFKGESPREPKDGISIKIRPHAQHASHPLMRDVFPLSTWTERQFTWQLDSRSHLVADNPLLVPLVVSPDMDDKKMGSNVVAFTFTFPPGAGGRAGATGKGGRARGGVVLHVSSHFKNQKDESGDGFALQQILLNLIVEKQDARRAANSR